MTDSRDLRNRMNSLKITKNPKKTVKNLWKPGFCS